MPISTHVPRAGDDDLVGMASESKYRISTHVPRAGDDPLTVLMIAQDKRFQPTSPVRETTSDNRDQEQERNISTHVPRAGDDHL